MIHENTLTGLLLFSLLSLAPAPALANGIFLGSPAAYRFGVPGALYASRIVAFHPQFPGDTAPGLDGSAALFAPDDIGFGPEPDTELSVALGTAGSIELAFSRSVVSDGVLAESIDQAELLIFEDGLLDGATFYGRVRGSGRLTPLGTIAQVVALDPTAPGFGPSGGDTVIGFDLDAIFGSEVDLVSILIVDDGWTGSSQTFEVDSLANRSAGMLVPEPGSLVLAAFGLAALVRTTCRRH